MYSITIADIVTLLSATISSNIITCAQVLLQYSEKVERSRTEYKDCCQLIAVVEGLDSQMSFLKRIACIVGRDLVDDNRSTVDLLDAHHDLVERRVDVKEHLGSVEKLLNVKRHDVIDAAREVEELRQRIKNVAPPKVTEVAAAAAAAVTAKRYTPISVPVVWKIHVEPARNPNMTERGATS